MKKLPSISLVGWVLTVPSCLFTLFSLPPQLVSSLPLSFSLPLPLPRCPSPPPPPPPPPPPANSAFTCWPGLCFVVFNPPAFIVIISLQSLLLSSASRVYCYHQPTQILVFFSHKFPILLRESLSLLLSSYCTQLWLHRNFLRFTPLSQLDF